MSSRETTAASPLLPVRPWTGTARMDNSKDRPVMPLFCIRDQPWMCLATRGVRGIGGESSRIQNRGITGRSLELSIRAVPVQGRTGNKGDAAVVSLDDIDVPASVAIRDSCDRGAHYVFGELGMLCFTAIRGLFSGG